MNKKILVDYIDACQMIKETEQDIKKIKEKKHTIIQTNVKGSNPDFPYQEQHFRVEGMAYTYSDDTQLRMEETLLKERKALAVRIKYEVEAWMNTIPMRIQRIIRYKIFEGLSWERTADRMGKGATGDSIRKEFERFLEKN